MLKEPRVGRVKTRLGRDIGMTTAAWWYRHQVRQLLMSVQDRRWQTVLAVAPDFEGMKSRIWPVNLQRFPQGTGNLGDRMARIMRGVGNGPVCVIGGDIPDIKSGHISRAFRALGPDDVVFGPAPDGGYWLVGMKHPKTMPSGLFQGVRWSTKHALTDTVATLKGQRIAMIDTLRDVDTGDDLAMTRRHPRVTATHEQNTIQTRDS